MGGVCRTCAGLGGSLTVVVGVAVRVSVSSIAKGRVACWWIVDSRSLMEKAGDKVWKRQPCWGSEAEEHDGGDYQRDADESHRAVCLSPSLSFPMRVCIFCCCVWRRLGNKCGCASTQINYIGTW